jgi:hypothetical protein
MIEHFELTFSRELPAWTATTGEWRIVGISLFARLIFVLFMFVVLFRVLKWQKDSRGSA